jgi:DnaK suppressor protein
MYPRIHAVAEAAARSGRIVVNIDGAVAALNGEREKLVRQLTELGATETGDLTGDVDYGDGFADAAAATAERSEVLGIVDNLTKLLADVDQALAKVDDGTYGLCKECGREIGAARMEFRPTSRYCVACKQRRSA